MELQKLQAWHLQTIALQDEQLPELQVVRSQWYFDAMKENGMACVQEDEVIACFGVQMLWAGRGMIWCVLSPNAGRYFVAGHRLALRYLEQIQVRRVEAYVRSGFASGVRWVQMLGFQHEGHMEGFFHDGADAELYSRIKKWL